MSLHRPSYLLFAASSNSVLDCGLAMSIVLTPMDIRTGRTPLSCVRASGVTLGSLRLLRSLSGTSGVRSAEETGSYSLSTPQHASQRSCNRLKRMAPVDVDRIRSVYTAPYYLSMHDLSEAQFDELVHVAKESDFDEVLWMLRTEEFRSRKMGAWFTLVRTEPEVDEELRQSLLTSRGRLTAPDLGIALAQRLGSAALPVLIEYQSIGIRDGHGPLGETSALIMSLGGTPLGDEPSELAAARMAALRDLATRIATQ